MRFQTRFFLLLLASASFCPVALAQLPQSEEVPTGGMARADVDFLTTADAANMDQLMLAKRAQSRAKDPGAHSLADNAVKSFTKADDALRLLAAAKHVDLAHRTTAKGKDEADALLDRRGPLDKAYVTDVARDMNDLIATYEGARDHSVDADIRRYADTMLSALQDLARQANDTLVRENVKP